MAKQHPVTTAVVLAGGLGTRLAGVLEDRPKVLAPVGGRRFLAYLLDQLADAGFRDVILCTGHLGEQVQEAFGRRFRRLHLAYSQERRPLGTGGAVRNALALLEGDNCLVVNGDSYCEVDLGAFLGWSRRVGARASLVLTQVADQARFGQIECDSGHRILRFAEKSNSGSGWINAGIYALSRQLISQIPGERAVSLERECFPWWAKDGMFGYRAGGRFLDIGTPESLENAQAFFRTSDSSAEVGGNGRSVLLDRDGTLVLERDYLRTPSQLELFPGSALAIQSLRKLGFGVVLVTNQSGLARGFFDENQLQEVHERLREILGDRDVALDAIYHCPHLPEHGCSCRKPEPGLVMRAVHDLGIDPRESFVVGDKACDIDLGRRVGATTVLVETGYGREALAAGVRADYTIKHIGELALLVENHLKTLGNVPQV
jgi:histidinol-phosphate phosphatase family protein